jgi:hypothetical protein
MRTTTRAALATTALIGIVAGPALSTTATSTASAAPETVRERGVVLDCTGTLRGQQVVAQIYENGTYGNSVTVAVGDLERSGVAGDRLTDRPFWVGKQVKATVKLAGRKATVSGTARSVGAKRAVHDSFDDAGEHIVVDGSHRTVVTDLTLTYRGAKAALTCDDAFRYDLRVTKEPIA